MLLLKSPDLLAEVEKLRKAISNIEKAFTDGDCWDYEVDEERMVALDEVGRLSLSDVLSSRSCPACSGGPEGRDTCWRGLPGTTRIWS